MTNRNRVRRRTDWEDILMNFAVADGATNVQNLLSRQDRDETGGWTVVRMLIHLYVLPSSLSEAAVGDQRVGFGIGVAEGDAFDAAALPEPLTAADHPLRDWIWRETAYVRNTGTAGGAIHVSELRADLHSQRKVDGGVPYMVIENAGINATAFSIRVVGLIRTLYLLP